MKVSLKVKAFCYAMANLSLIGLCGMQIIESAPLSRTLIIYIASLVWINFLFWFMFRLRDKSNNEMSPSGPQSKQ
jgi:hypothetical protein